VWANRCTFEHLLKQARERERGEEEELVGTGQKEKPKRER